MLSHKLDCDCAFCKMNRLLDEVIEPRLIINKVTYDLNKEELRNLQEIMYWCDDCEGYHLLPDDGFATYVYLGELLTKKWTEAVGEMMK